MTATRQEVDWGAILARLDLLAFDFQRHLGLRLTAVLHTHTWQEFAHLVQGLLGMTEYLVGARGPIPIPSTLIGTHFHEPDDPEETPDG